MHFRKVFGTGCVLRLAKALSSFLHVIVGAKDSCVISCYIVLVIKAPFEKIELLLSTTLRECIYSLNV